MGAALWPLSIASARRAQADTSAARACLFSKPDHRRTGSLGPKLQNAFRVSTIPEVHLPFARLELVMALFLLRLFSALGVPRVLRAWRALPLVALALLGLASCITTTSLWAIRAR